MSRYHKMLRVSCSLTNWSCNTAANLSVWPMMQIFIIAQIAASHNEWIFMQHGGFHGGFHTQFLRSIYSSRCFSISYIFIIGDQAPHTLLVNISWQLTSNNSCSVSCNSTFSASYIMKLIGWLFILTFILHSTTSNTVIKQNLTENPIKIAYCCKNNTCMYIHIYLFK